MFTQGQHVYINDTHSRFHGKEAIILTCYGDYFDVQIRNSVLLRVVYEQMSTEKPTVKTPCLRHVA